MLFGKIRYTIATLVLLLTSVYFMGCEPSDREFQNGPTITFDGNGITGDDTYSQGRTAHFNAIFAKGSGGANLSKVRVVRRVGDNLATLLDESLDAATYVFDQSVVLEASKVLGPGETETQTFIFTALDRAGHAATRQIVITLESAELVKESKYFENIVFSNANPYFSTLSTAGTSAMTENQANAAAGAVDLSYYFNSSITQHSFVAPLRRATIDSSSPLYWASGEINTNFRSTSADAALFAEAKANQNVIASVYANSSDAFFTGETNGVRVGGTDVAVGKVVAFRGLNNKLGLMLVKGVTNGSLAVDIVIEK